MSNNYSGRLLKRYETIAVHVERVVPFQLSRCYL